jgi:subtilisin family serine protease
VPVKVLNKRGSGTYDAIIAGVNYVAANGSSGDVANMSLGGGVSTALNTAVINAAATGIKFALAAGNESTSATTKSPASANAPNIYTISAMATGDLWAYYSNYGNPPVDYCEPGSSIYSTYKGGGYATLSGTSMAAPHAAGILLLGNIRTDGYVLNDPDGNADPIGVH